MRSDDWGFVWVSKSIHKTYSSTDICADTPIVRKLSACWMTVMPVTVAVKRCNISYAETFSERLFESCKIILQDAWCKVVQGTMCGQSQYAESTDTIPSVMLSLLNNWAALAVSNVNMVDMVLIGNSPSPALRWCDDSVSSVLRLCHSCRQQVNQQMFDLVYACVGLTQGSF